MENEEKKDEKVEVLDDNTSNNQNQEVPHKKKKKSGIIVVVILLLAFFCVGGVFLLKDNIPSKTKKAGVDVKKVKSEYRMSGNSLENFDLYFLKLENEAKNKVYSPLSIKYALEMLAEGSEGNTKKQIEAVVGDYKAKSYPNSEHMSFANAMFIKDTFKDEVKSTYIDTLKNKYNAEVILDPFASPDNINSWVSNKTFKLINNLVDNVDDNVFFLINALAIDMNWKNQIHCESSHKIPCVDGGNYRIEYLHEKLDDDSTMNYDVVEYPYSSEDDFFGGYNRKNEFNGKENAKGGEILADFNKYDIIKELGEDKIREIITPEYEEWLKTPEGQGDLPLEEGVNKFINELKENYGKKANSTDFLVNETDNVKTFAKDLDTYDGMTLQYVAIMPKEKELTDFIKDTNKDELNKMISDLKEVNIDSFEEGYVTRIRGFIPFFKYEYKLELLKDLQELGIKDVFDSKADLSNMINSKGISIDKAIHQATIELSNDGIKASAATAFGGAGAATGPYFEHLFKVPVKEIDMTFNKPFMYIIRDKDSGEVWFTGTVYEPIYK